MIRRTLDLLVGSLGLVALSPVLAVIAVTSRLLMGPGVLFRQWRLGRGGHPFVLYKLRTMRPPAPGRSEPVHDGDRIPPFGRWLRRTSLDEIPSLWNLFRGDMTLVGPRPLPVHYWDRFRGDEYERFRVRPGVTGLAQVRGRNLLGWDERLQLDVDYVRSRTLLGDLRLLGSTVSVVVSGTGVEHSPGQTMGSLPADRDA